MLYKDLLFFGLFTLILIIIVFSIYYIKKRFDYYDSKILDLSNALFSLIKNQTEQNNIDSPYYENKEYIKQETRIKQDKPTTELQTEIITDEIKNSDNKELQEEKEILASTNELINISNNEKAETKEDINNSNNPNDSVISCINQETEIKKSDDSPIIECQEDKQEIDKENIFSSFLSGVLINDDKQETQKKVDVYIYNDKTEEFNAETENKTFTITPGNQEIINSEHSSNKESENTKDSDVLTKLINQQKMETIEKFKSILKNDIKTIKLSDLKNIVKTLNINLDKQVNKYKKDELYEVCSVYINANYPLDN